MKTSPRFLACLLVLPVAAAGVTFGGCGGGGDTGNGGSTGASTSATTSGSKSGSTSGTSGGGGGGAPKADEHVTVLFTSDEHSHLFAFSPELDDFPIATKALDGSLVGGVARRATLIASERKAAESAGMDSILVSAGDNQMGCLPHVAFESDSIDYQTMKSLGYDVTTFGNHEFDFGPKALATAIKTAQSNGGLPPIVASNIHFSSSSKDDDTLAALYSTKVTDSAAVHPYRVVTTKRGVKIGVLGYVGVNASLVAPNKTPVAFSENGVPVAMAGDQATVLPKLYMDLQPVVDTLRNTEKVDLVVALAHGGINDTSTEAGIEAGDDWNVCKNVTGIDLIVSGHAHNPDPKPIEVTNVKKGSCLVLNGSSFGQHLGRVVFTIPGDASKPVSWDKSTQTLIPVNDKTVPDSKEAALVPPWVEIIEKAGQGGSFLEALLSRTTGKAIKNDTSKAGDLYFYPIGKTGYDIPFNDTDVANTYMLTYLSADATMTAADTWGKTQTPKLTNDIAIESAGVIRSGIAKGQTGVIAAADAFNVVPLGASPVDGTLGYPLIRAFVATTSLRGVIEYSLALGAGDSDYMLGFSGIKVEYDATRPLATSKIDLFDPNKGQVMLISLDTDHSDGLEQFDTVIYDRVNNISSKSLLSVVTSSYIGQFAAGAGVTLADSMGNAVTLDQSIVHRNDKSEIKQLEAFFGYLHNNNGGVLPPTYDKTSPKATTRWVCTKGC